MRFPEFKGAEPWGEKRVGDALTFQTGFPFDSLGFNDEANGVRLIKNRDLKADDRVAYYSKPFDERFIVNNGDILIGMDGDFAPYIWNKGRALLNQRVGRILVNAYNDQSFFFYLLTIHLKAVEEVTARTNRKTSITLRCRKALCANSVAIRTTKNRRLPFIPRRWDSGGGRKAGSPQSA